MKEIRNIIAAYHEAKRQNKQAALATVVHVEGSSYRRPGARMLITDDGQLTGAISGGCLEGDALRKALLVMARQKPMLVTYDTLDEDDAKFGAGLGCNGIIQVLIEPIDAAGSNNPIQLMEALPGKRQKAILVTLFSLAQKNDPQQGTCLLVKEDGTVTKVQDDLLLQDILVQDAGTALTTQASSFKKYILDKKEVTAFIEFIKPTVSLVIIGAGNDVMPLVEMADILGWESRVADGRATYARQNRFEKACEVMVAKPGDLLEKVAVDDQTVFLLMTHNYNYDKAMLAELIKREIVYIGMLGPVKKLGRILEEFKEEGIELNARQLSMIHSPVGLDIGAETPEEIALSILSEIKSVLSGKKGESLRQYSSAIHPRSGTAIEEVRVPSGL